MAGYRYLLGDFEPYIYRTDDFGATWTRLTDGENGIPHDYPTRVIREDPERKGLLYAGTEFGLFISFDDGKTWEKFQQGLPVTPITDLKVHREDLVLSTMGRGFWILDNVTALHHVTLDIVNSDAYLFPIRDTYRVRYNSSSGGSAAPSYPRSGVVIDYYFKEEQIGDVTLDILDHEGKIVRTIEAEEFQSELAAVQGMRAPPRLRAPASALERASGMHRYTWDMRHSGLSGPGLRNLQGPLVPPGTYQVRLNVDGETFAQEAVLLIDPRVAADNVKQSDLQAQFEFGVELMKARGDAAAAVQRIDALIKDTEDKAARKTAKQLRALLVTAVGDSYPQPMLIDQLRYLSGFTSQGDFRPGKDAYERLVRLQSDLAGIIQQLGEL